MKQAPSLHQLIRELWMQLAPRRRIQFGFLLLLIVISALSEVISIGATLPFLAALTAPSQIFDHSAAQPLIKLLDLKSADQILLPLTIIFIIAALMASAMRLLLTWLSVRLTFSVGVDLSVNVYRRTLYQPYSVHINRNSSEVINGVTAKIGQTIFYVLMPVLSLISASIILIIISTAIVFSAPVMVLGILCGFGFIYACINRLTSSRLKSDSHRIAVESTEVIKCLQEGLGGIRDILIDGTQEEFCNKYKRSELILRRAQGNNQIISQVPRYIIEALAMIVMAILAYWFSQQPNGIGMAIPLLATMVFGMQRLLPALQQIYAAWSSIQGFQASLQNTLELLKQPIPDDFDRSEVKPITFKHQINLKNVSFSYNAITAKVLKNIDLTITKGSRVGFVGTTGSGKSTLLDIIMGLLQPTEGSIEIDGQQLTIKNHPSWQSYIAHVPQVVFLADASIEENIAFGIHKNQIDHARVRMSAKQAQIDEVIESLPDKYQTSVGERGIQLSGGQRQRLGIARALYKQAEVIIFDEATSALDGNTEEAVIQAIENLSEDLTILIIAHRLTSLRSCTEIIEISDGAIRKKANINEKG